MGIRIIGGTHRGRHIESPSNDAIRPTTGVVREAIFSRFQREIIQGRFLDLFAGSGLMGFEALSRGARWVTWVEKNPAHARLIQQNRKSLGGEDPFPGEIVTQSVEKFLLESQRKGAELNEPYDVIFMDPPYGYPPLMEIVKGILDLETHPPKGAPLKKMLSPGGILVVEHSKRESLLSENFPGGQCKGYGETMMEWFSVE
ncbi:MAG: 16S rRNA (guanine(966)-N(2))-methyltransferase RsmD [Cyanobacteria bacterium]|nr:16S rRNA (guanine(966)-N(2))-methyltransferase RsmD [Cyanobacteriota bacterium]